jgi:5-methylcytosine-specific restriction endonuclease McrA
MNSAYYKLLKHKRWYDKRKEILQRDEYTCTSCGSKANLRVHHTFYYSPWIAPWMYPDDSLITVCKKCHDDYHLHHETENRKLPKKKKQPKIRKKKQVKKTTEKIPNRTLKKIQYGRFHIYELKTNH